jgi:hypothetical protein
MGDENERNISARDRKNKTSGRLRDKYRSPFNKLDQNAKLLTNQIDSALLTE